MIMKRVLSCILVLIALISNVSASDLELTNTYLIGNNQTSGLFDVANIETGNFFSNNVTVTIFPDINLSFGPPDTTIFRIGTCGASIQNYSAVPENQTETYGIDLICNNGTKKGDVYVKLSETLNTGWYLYASNISITENLINLTTTPQLIYSSLQVGQCFYVWFVATCLNVTQGLGAYEVYSVV